MLSYDSLGVHEALSREKVLANHALEDVEVLLVFYSLADKCISIILP